MELIGPPHSVNNFVSLEICFIGDCFLGKGAFSPVVLLPISPRP